MRATCACCATSPSRANMSHQTHVVLARDLYPQRLPGDEPEALELVPWKLTDLGQLILRENSRRGAASPRCSWCASGCSSMRMDEALREGVIALAIAPPRDPRGVRQRRVRGRGRDPAEGRPLAVDRRRPGLAPLHRRRPRGADAGACRCSPRNRRLWRSPRAGWQRFWLVDPLDGTREFIKRNGEFTVNIALVEAGVAVFG